MWVLCFIGNYFFCFSFSVNKDVDRARLDDSLTNIQWLGKMNTCTLDSGKKTVDEENQNPNSQAFQVSCSFLWKHDSCSVVKTSNWNYSSDFAYLDRFPIICLGLFLFFWTETKSTNGCRSGKTASLREASVLLHGDDPVRHQQPEEQADDAERDLQLDRGPLPVLQTGGQTGLEGTRKTEQYEGEH